MLPSEKPPENEKACMGSVDAHPRALRLRGGADALLPEDHFVEVTDLAPTAAPEAQRLVIAEQLTI